MAEVKNVFEIACVIAKPTEIAEDKKNVGTNSNQKLYDKMIQQLEQEGIQKFTEPFGKLMEAFTNKIPLHS
jgi:transaldolase